MRLPSSNVLFLIALLLPLLLLLGLVFPGLGIGHIPRVKLHLHTTDMISLRCSSEAAFPSRDSRSLRMIQVGHVGETGHTTTLATVDVDGVSIPDTVLKNMGERSLHVSGSLNEADVSWLHFRVFDFELDQSMKNYGTFTCSVWHSDEDNAWSVENNFIPGVSLPLEKPGFVIRKESALDLTCLATVPTLSGSDIVTLRITQTWDGEPMATWRADEVAHCSDAFLATCSPLQNLHEVYYARVRLMKLPEVETHYQCSVEVTGTKDVSTVVQFKPDSMCDSPETTSTLLLVLGASCIFILGCLLTVRIINRRAFLTCLKEKLCGQK